MNLITKLLRRNISPARMAGFVVSNFLGLLIVCGALQFYTDASTLWESEESFLRNDRLILNKRVGGEALADSRVSQFTDSEISDIEKQPWVRSVGRFRSADFRVDAILPQGGRDLSTALFFESVPDRYLDVSNLPGWHYDSTSGTVPVVIPRDYLALYNFGFATSAGMPRLSEQLVSGIPLLLRIRSADGSVHTMQARIVGFTSRMNTILVPDAFLRDANSRFGRGEAGEGPTRLAVEVSRPGDTAITRYLESKDFEQAGEQGRGSAAFLLRVVAMTVGAVGIAITLMSLLSLLLSVSLLMEKNRDRIHSLLMLGAPLSEVGRPYSMAVIAGSISALVLALVGVLLLRSLYLPALTGLGLHEGSILPSLIAGAALTLLVAGLNVIAVRRRISRAWRL